MTKIQAIKDLVEYDHCFLSPEGVRHFCQPFGFDEKEFIHEAVDNRSDFKGLRIADGKEGDKIDGCGADFLAETFCRKLNVSYTPMYGRGSRLRECCRALLEYLEKTK
jgi:hypothetical protein